VLRHSRPVRGEQHFILASMGAGCDPHWAITQPMTAQFARLRL